MTPADKVLIAVVVVAAIALALIYWRWPAALSTPRAATSTRRARATSSRSGRDVSTPAIRASWAAPPYDWQRRPGGRHAVGLPTPAGNAARAAARRDVGFIRDPR
jgi:hypothetical protein